MRTILKSVRLPEDISHQLDLLAHRKHRAKNWVIVEALQIYFEREKSQSLNEEARKQSLRVSKEASRESPEVSADTSGWEW